MLTSEHAAFSSIYAYKRNADNSTVVNPIIAISRSLGLPIVRQAQTRLEPETY